MNLLKAVKSHPTMGAWIEIFNLAVERNFKRSHPTMGAWIEISFVDDFFSKSTSHPTMGAWIEIFSSWFRWLVFIGRTPRWVRGLKSCYAYCFVVLLLSHPTMGAWIEINPPYSKKTEVLQSHPTMGAWIEMIIVIFPFATFSVAPHDGCVD